MTTEETVLYEYLWYNCYGTPVTISTFLKRTKRHSGFAGRVTQLVECAYVRGEAVRVRSERGRTAYVPVDSPRVPNEWRKYFDRLKRD